MNWQAWRIWITYQLSRPIKFRPKLKIRNKLKGAASLWKSEWKRTADIYRPLYLNRLRCLQMLIHLVKSKFKEKEQSSHHRINLAHPQVKQVRKSNAEKLEQPAFGSVEEERDEKPSHIHHVFPWKILIPSFIVCWILLTIGLGSINWTKAVSYWWIPLVIAVTFLILLALVKMMRSPQYREKAYGYVSSKNFLKAAVVAGLVIAGIILFLNWDRDNDMKMPATADATVSTTHVTLFPADTIYDTVMADTAGSRSAEVRIPAGMNFIIAPEREETYAIKFTLPGGRDTTIIRHKDSEHEDLQIKTARFRLVAMESDSLPFTITKWR